MSPARHTWQRRSARAKVRRLEAQAAREAVLFADGARPWRRPLLEETEIALAEARRRLRAEQRAHVRPGVLAVAASEEHVR